MERSERITLIKKIGHSLVEEGLTDLNLTLRTFEFATRYFDPEEWDNYSYVVNQLEDGSDAQLAELHRHLFPGDATSSVTPLDAPGRWAAGMFRLFLSHTTTHRGSAARLRKQLAEWGVDTFVAHDVIEPTREWQDEIEMALLTCDALAAMLTTDFIESRWCDQEVGVAIARKVLIVPIKIDADPHGFIGKYQAVTIPAPTSPYVVADAVFDVLARSDLTSESMAPAIVRRYANSDSLDNTRAAFVLLTTIAEVTWTDPMVEQVERAAQLNSQVANCKLPGGRLVSEAAEELLVKVRRDGPAVSGTENELVTFSGGDDDIPF